MLCQQKCAAKQQLPQPGTECGDISSCLCRDACTVGSKQKKYRYNWRRTGKEKTVVWESTTNGAKQNSWGDGEGESLKEKRAEAKRRQGVENKWGSDENNDREIRGGKKERLEWLERKEQNGYSPADQQNGWMDGWMDGRTDGRNVFFCMLVCFVSSFIT